MLHLACMDPQLCTLYSIFTPFVTMNNYYVVTDLKPSLQKTINFQVLSKSLEGLIFPKNPLEIIMALLMPFQLIHSFKRVLVFSSCAQLAFAMSMHYNTNKSFE